MSFRRLKTLFESAIHSSVLRQSSNLFVSSLLSTGFSIIGSIVLARAFGPEKHGLIVLAMAIVIASAQFMDIRSREALVKFMGGALAKGNRGQAITFFYVGLTTDALLALVTFAVIKLIAPMVVHFHEQGALLYDLIEIYVLTIPFSTMAGSFLTLLIIFRRFRLYAMANVFNNLIVLVCLIVFSRWGMNAVMWSYVIASALALGTWIVLGLRLLFKHFDVFRSDGYFIAVREFLSFAFHTSLTASIKAIFDNIDILLLGALRPAQEVSFYKIARSAASLLYVPVAPVRTVVYPTMNEAWARNDLAAVRRLIKKFVLYSVAVSGAASLFLFIAADLLVYIFYGPEFAPVANLARLLSMAQTFSNIVLWIWPATLSGGKPQLLTITNTSMSAVRILLLALLVPIIGATGAALAFMISMGSFVVLSGLYVAPALKLWKPSWSRKSEGQPAP